ncbi:hypothetical protein [Mycobacterium sp.]
MTKPTTAAMAANREMTIESHGMWIDEVGQHEKNAPANKHTP